MVRDGQGKVECCYSNGCNSDLTTATRSLQYLDRPMNSVEINLIQQKAENIQRLRELEETRTRQILGRSGLALTEEVGGGEREISCFTCNMMDNNNYRSCPGTATSFPGSSACRVMALSNGTVVQQAVSPVELCQSTHLASLKRAVAKERFQYKLLVFRTFYRHFPTY